MGLRVESTTPLALSATEPPANGGLDQVIAQRVAEVVRATLRTLPTTPPAPWPQLLRQVDAARYLGCDSATVARLTKDGALPTVPFLSERRYRLCDLERYVAQLGEAGQ